MFYCVTITDGTVCYIHSVWNLSKISHFKMIWIHTVLNPFCLNPYRFESFLLESLQIWIPLHLILFRFEIAKIWILVQNLKWDILVHFSRLYSNYGLNSEKILCVPEYNLIPNFLAKIEWQTQHSLILS